MACIIKRGDYQYQVTVRRKGFPKQCKTFESEREAKDWAHVIESEMVRSVFTDRSELERTTLFDILSRYSIEVTLEKAGARQELDRINFWKAHPLAARSLASLRPADFSQFRDARLKEVGGNSVRLELALISAMLNHARKEWSLPVENFVKGIRPPKAPPGRERRLMGNEEERLLEAAGKARAHPQQLKAAILLAIETGIREGRLAELRWEQVDLHEGIVWVKTKDEQHRQKLVPVPLSLKAVAIFKGLPRSINGKVFGVAFPTGSTLGSAFSRARKRAGLENLTFHDLRHEAASRLAPKLPMATLAKVMTWKTLAMSMRYYNPKPNELVAAIRAAT